MRRARALGCPQGEDLLQLLARLGFQWDGEMLEAEMSSKDEFRIIQVGRELGSQTSCLKQGQSSRIDPVWS